MEDVAVPKISAKNLERAAVALVALKRLGGE